IDANATRYDEVGYQELLAKDLRVMDPSAVSLMRDNNIPIVVFSLKEEGSLLKVLHGKGTSTTINNHGA
ncbi:MAG TPA: UMP kinase, partial [Hyphomonas sp.]|nr:UMP kinase [Hyphomonas sp.]